MIEEPNEERKTMYEACSKILSNIEKKIEEWNKNG